MADKIFSGGVDSQTGAGIFEALQFKRQILSEQCQHKNKIMSALKKKGKVSVTILCATQALVKTN